MSLISRALKERQYRRVYLKQMHEWLKDYSERTLAGGVYQTSPAIVQPWKSQEKKMKNSEDYHTGQKYQNQIVVPTQNVQISPNTF